MLVCSCFIIDDESHAIELLSDYIKQTPGLELIGSEQNPIKGLHRVTALEPNIVFLDIDMPGLSGIDLFKSLKGQYTVVFTTGHANYAVDAFEVEAADFLLKPIRYSRFLTCIDKLTKRINALTLAESRPPGEFMFLQSGTKGKMIKIYFADILYAESFHNYVTIHHKEEQITTYTSLKELINQLPTTTFIRIHKSYLVNYHHIKTIEGNRVFLTLGTELPVGKEFRDGFQQLVRIDTLKKK